MSYVSKLTKVFENVTASSQKKKKASGKYERNRSLKELADNFEKFEDGIHSRTSFGSPRLHGTPSITEEDIDNISSKHSVDRFLYKGCTMNGDLEEHKSDGHQVDWKSKRKSRSLSNLKDLECAGENNGTLSRRKNAGRNKSRLRGLDLADKPAIAPKPSKVQSLLTKVSSFSKKHVQVSERYQVETKGPKNVNKITPEELSTKSRKDNLYKAKKSQDYVNVNTHNGVLKDSASNSDQYFTPQDTYDNVSFHGEQMTSNITSNKQSREANGDNTIAPDKYEAPDEHNAIPDVTLSIISDSGESPPTAQEMQNIFERNSRYIVDGDNGRPQSERWPKYGAESSPEEGSDEDWDWDGSFESETEVEVSVEIAQAKDEDPCVKLKKIVNELLSTEEAYVDRLKLIDQVFYFEIYQANKKHHMFPQEFVLQMFPNVKNIYSLHKDHVLPRLKERLKIWDEDPRIGDIMSDIAPFFKMYTEYAKNFDRAMNLINEWKEKSAKFSSVLIDIQARPICENLTLQHHMLEPIQRIPRYEMLLKDYLKRLPEHHLDYANVEKALNLVTTAAKHSNEGMKNIEHFQKLLDVYQRLNASIDLISPTRRLIKEGRVVKISARSGDQLDRYAFLFNDLFLLCSEPFLGNYKIKAKLEVDGMEIMEGERFGIENTFVVRSRQKNLELHLSTAEEKIDWHLAFVGVVQSFHKLKEGLQQTKITLSRDGMVEDSLTDEELGKRAPSWVKDDAVSMCMICRLTFSTLTRRHHCRACGHVVCSRCSKFKQYLEFAGKEQRVCKRCFKILPERDLSKSADNLHQAVQSKKKKGVLDVKATDPSEYSGYMWISTNAGKTWNKRWFAIHEDFVLYSFKAHKDVHALTSMPLPGYVVDFPPDKEDNIERDNVFKLSHPTLNTTVFFQCDNDSLFRRWTSVLEKTVRAESSIWVVRETVRKFQNKVTVRRPLRVKPNTS